MSKRFDDLMYNAGLTADGCWFEMDNYDQMAIMKFADLIVQDCLNIIEELSPGYQDYRNQIEDAFRRDCIESIKEHFGVKE